MAGVQLGITSCVMFREPSRHEDGITWPSVGWSSQHFQLLFFPAFSSFYAFLHFLIFIFLPFLSSNTFFLSSMFLFSFTYLSDCFLCLSSCIWPIPSSRCSGTILSAVVPVDAVTDWQVPRGWRQPRLQVRPQPAALITCQPSSFMVLICLQDRTET